ncbi:MAG: VOC family protein [Pseudomonadota bacterium]
MKQHGSINHIAITVTDLDASLEFFKPFLGRLGFTVGTPSPYAGTRLAVNVNEGNGIAFNVWEAKQQHPFEVYEPGLHHVAFNAGSKELVDELFEIVKQAECEVLEVPAEFGFALGGYYAFYFLGPDRLKFEVVYMPELD